MKLQSLLEALRGCLDERTGIEQALLSWLSRRSKLEPDDDFHKYIYI